MKYIKFFAVSLVSALVLCEVVLHLIAAVLVLTTPPSVATVPDRFGYGPEFEREYDAIIKSKTYRNDIEWIPEFHGKYFTIIDNRRITTDQPANAPHTLWVFGSSTVLCLQVPDNLTLPSYLQRFIGSQYIVQNMGVNTSSAVQEYALLKQTPIRRGDVVVFYDGAIDELGPYFVIANRREQEPNACPWLMANASWSFIVQAICSSKAAIVPSTEMINDNYQQYTRTVAKARTYVQTRGATFYHVLQPTTFIGFREDDAPISNAYAPTVLPSVALYEQSPNTIDLTHIFDEWRRSRIVVYVDWVHVNARGNERIAREIAAWVGAF